MLHVAFCILLFAFQARKALWVDVVDVFTRTPQGETMGFPKVCLRVLDPQNKRKYTSHALSSLPPFLNVADFKEFILKNYSTETGAQDTSFQIGYYGKPRNERFLITTDSQFEEALSLEQKGWLTFWLSTESCKRLSPASESTPRSSKKSKGNYNHHLACMC